MGMETVIVRREPKIPTRAPLFLLRETSHAACVQIYLLKSWLLRERNVLQLSTVERPESRQGIPLMFTWRRVCQIALMEALGRLCWLPSVAAKAAVIFSDVGEDGAEIAGCFGPDVTSRAPAELFPTGNTILATRFLGGDSCEPRTEVHKIPDDMTFAEFWPLVTAGADGISLVDCGAVVDRINARLGIETE